MNVARLIEHLIHYPPNAVVKFADGPTRELVVLSVYDDQGKDRRYNVQRGTPIDARCAIVWVDVGEVEDPATGELQAPMGDQAALTEAIRIIQWARDVAPPTVPPERIGAYSQAIRALGRIGEKLERLSRREWRRVEKSDILPPGTPVDAPSRLYTFEAGDPGHWEFDLPEIPRR